MFWFNPAGYPLATLAGQTETIFLVGGYGFPVFDFPFLPQGPVLWTAVTIADAESGRSETFDVAVEFYDFEPTQPPGRVGVPRAPDRAVQCVRDRLRQAPVHGRQRTRPPGVAVRVN